MMGKAGLVPYIQLGVRKYATACIVQNQKRPNIHGGR